MNNGPRMLTGGADAARNLTEGWGNNMRCVLAQRGLYLTGDFGPDGAPICAEDLEPGTKAKIYATEQEAEGVKAANHVLTDFQVAPLRPLLMQPFISQLKGYIEETDREIAVATNPRTIEMLQEFRQTFAGLLEHMEGPGDDSG